MEDEKVPRWLMILSSVLFPLMLSLGLIAIAGGITITVLGWQFGIRF